MMKTKFEVLDLNGVELTADLSKVLEGEIYFNATIVAKQFGKDVREYLKNKSTKEYEAALEESRLIDGNSPQLKITRTGRKYGGTWLHQDLFLGFARWCSAAFAVRMDQWVKAKIEEERVKYTKRLEAKTGYLPLTEAIQDAHNPDKHYHYSNENNMLYRIITGMDAKKYKEIHGVDSVRDNMTEQELDMLSKLQRMNTALIELGVDYQERKGKLSEYYSRRATSLNLGQLD